MIVERASKSSLINLSQLSDGLSLKICEHEKNFIPESYNYDLIRTDIMKYISAVTGNPVSDFSPRSKSSDMIASIFSQYEKDKQFDLMVKLCDAALKHGVMRVNGIPISSVMIKAETYGSIHKKIIDFGWKRRLKKVKHSYANAVIKLITKKNKASRSFENYEKSIEIYELLKRLDDDKVLDIFACKKEMFKFSFAQHVRPEPVHIKMLMESIRLLEDCVSLDEKVFIYSIYYEKLKFRLTRYISANYIRHSIASNDKLLNSVIVNMHRYLSQIFYEIDDIFLRHTCHNSNGQSIMDYQGEVRLLNLLNNAFDTRIEDMQNPNKRQIFFVNKLNLQIRIKLDDQKIEMTIGFFREDPMIRRQGVPMALRINKNMKMFYIQDRYNEVFKYVQGYVIPACHKDKKTKVRYTVATWQTNMSPTTTVDQNDAMNRAHTILNTQNFSWQNSFEFSIFNNATGCDVYRHDGSTTKASYENQNGVFVKTK